MASGNRVSGYVGNRRNKCRICGAEGEFACYEVKEMFYGTREPFLYFECPECHCMQIMEIPEDIGKYYKNNYYSFREPEILSKISLNNEIRYSEKILDVGCGSGAWLLERAQEGYANLYGCDPFIPESVKYGDRVTIEKCSLHEMTGEFDVITFHDSFEHMADPLEEMLSVKNLLAPDGICSISIPVFPNIAYEAFGINWYQWDAPRHFFLHSRQSMEYLCEQAGLVIKNVEYDGGTFQFLVSYCYEAGFPLVKIPQNITSLFPQEDVEGFRKLTASANANGTGDHAKFLIMHK